MPIDSKHPLYDTKIKLWKAARDCYEGEEAMRKAGTTYVPKLSGMTGTADIEGAYQDNEYQAYLKRGMFYGATYRTVRALVGAVCRKAGKPELPDRNKELPDDITNSGISLEEFTKQVVGEIFLTGRGGIFVDRTPDGSKPYFCYYNAENITNWGEDDKKRFVVLREHIYVATDETDPYKIECKCQYREIVQYKSTDPTQERVEVCVWKEAVKSEGNNSASYTRGTPVILKNRAGNFTKMPFIFVSPDSRANKIDRPPMQDVVNVNISHWRNSVDLEYGRHVLGLPTPYMTGVDPANKEAVPLGPNVCIKLSDPNSKFGFAEFTGQGLSELRLAMKEKEDLMASLGARILSSQPKSTETAETAKIHAAGEDNALSSIVNGVEEAIEGALEIAVEWDGGDPKTVEYKMSRDFTNIKLDSQTIAALLTVVNANKMSVEAFLWNLLQGEVLPPDTTIEDEMIKIEKQRQEAADLQAEIFAKAGGPGATKFGSPVGKEDPKAKPGAKGGGVPSSGGSGSGSGASEND